MEDEVFDSGKAAGLGLSRSVEVFTHIIEWETRTRMIAPPKAYIVLCLAMFRDAAAENAAIYLSDYKTILNQIGVRDGRWAARRTLAVLTYAKMTLGSVIFPADFCITENPMPRLNALDVTKRQTITE